ncbi:MAG TPA: DUF885 domain-containing protein [Chthoniobacterales bacterium]
MNPVRQLRSLFDNYLQETTLRYPEHGSNLGFDEFRPLLSENTKAIHRDQNRLVEKTLAAVEALPESAFDAGGWLDRRIFASMLRRHRIFEGELQRTKRNPQGNCDAAIESIFELLVRCEGKLANALPAIESRLAKIPDYLAAGAKNIRKPVPLWVKLTEKACAGGIEFFDELGQTFQPIATPRTAALLKGAQAALKDYAQAISRKSAGPKDGFACGTAVFEELMRERLGFDWSVNEAAANGRRLVAEMQALLDLEARRLGKKTAREILDAAAGEWIPEKPLLSLYQTATDTVKERLRQRELMSLPPGETLVVLPVPAFLKHHFPTAAYTQPPPFSKKQQGIFWVNDLSLDAAGEAEKLAEQRQHFGLELTSAHEAYPGHHVQFATQNRFASKIRRLADHSISYEGWTMWCELMCVEQALVENPYARLQQLHDALWRAHRILIDAGLHTGMSFDWACRTLMEGVGFTRARAEGDVNWYSSSPTVPMSYLLGRLEMERLHAHFVLKGNWTLRQFNDWLLSYGAIPQRWIWQSLLR